MLSSETLVQKPTGRRASAVALLTVTQFCDHGENFAKQKALGGAWVLVGAGILRQPLCFQ